MSVDSKLSQLGRAESPQYRFEPMSQRQARAVAAWRYDPPYDFYDMVADPEDLAEVLDPVQRAGRDFAVLGDPGGLVGFFMFKHQGTRSRSDWGCGPTSLAAGVGSPSCSRVWRSRVGGTHQRGSGWWWPPSISGPSVSTSGRGSVRARHTCTEPMGASTCSCAWSGRHDVGHAPTPSPVRYIEYRLQLFLLLNDAGTPNSGSRLNRFAAGSERFSAGQSSWSATTADVVVRTGERKVRPGE